MSNLKIAGAVLLGAALLGGCATQGFVKHETAEVNNRVTGVSGRVDAVATHLDAVDQNTKEAMARATAAGKLAEGKFLYSMVLSDDSVKFPVDGAQLSPEAQTRLQDFVQKLKGDNKNVYIEIQGHTDATGGKSVNMKLGEQRAEAVRLFLNQQGVPLNRMAAISYGDNSPAADNKTRAGRAQNRRVVVIVMS